MSSSVLVSVAIGLGCAVGGVLANPKAPSRADTGRAVLIAVLAVVPVLAWMLWRGQIIATMLPFLAGSLTGELRSRLFASGARDESTEPVSADSPQADGSSSGTLELPAGTNEWAGSGFPRS